jgi:hypothetical protein
MCDFKKMLILSYFFQFKSDYLLSKLQEILGLTSFQLENRITDLIEHNLLEYKENLLSITPKGVQFVLSKNIESFPFEVIKNSEISNKITYQALSLDDTYIPEKFIEKYNRK